MVDGAEAVEPASLQCSLARATHTSQKSGASLASQRPPWSPDQHFSQSVPPSAVGWLRTAPSRSSFFKFEVTDWAAAACRLSG